VVFVIPDAEVVSGAGSAARDCGPHTRSTGRARPSPARSTRWPGVRWPSWPFAIGNLASIWWPALTPR